MATEFRELGNVQSGSVLSFDRRGTGVSRWLRRSGDAFNGSAIAEVDARGVVCFWYIGRGGIRCKVLNTSRLRRYNRVEATGPVVDGSEAAAEFGRLDVSGARYVLWHMPISWLLAAAREPKSRAVSLVLRALILPVAISVALVAKATDATFGPSFVCSTMVDTVLQSCGVDLGIRLTRSKWNQNGDASGLDRLLARYFLTPSDVQRALAGVKIVQTADQQQMAA